MQLITLIFSVFFSIIDALENAFLFFQEKVNKK